MVCGLDCLLVSQLIRVIDGELDEGKVSEMATDFDELPDAEKVCYYLLSCVV